MTRFPLLRFCISAFIVLFAQTTQAAEPAVKTPPNASQQVDFNTQIRPLLSNNCLFCHGPDAESREADLRLDFFKDATQDRGGYAAIVPGQPDKSELIHRITSTDSDLRMPPEGKGRQLTSKEVALIERWIREGANYAQHWSYVEPLRPALPIVANKKWPKNPIDYFILHRLEKEKLQPGKQADRLTLARRVALDLTGLPPTWEEAEAFVNDDQPNAYERYVDQQLAKPAYGERWAANWLDLARYADSAGYADDPPRTIWAFRDYVIRSFNANKPFDQFTIEQIAGDLLPDPTEEQLIATAFHRNTLTNNEGGTNDEEFRNVAIVDRVNTTMAVWMGTTIACAQCHTHKYDPISQREYYQLFDFFNQSKDSDKRDERPFYAIWTHEQKQKKIQWATRIAELKTILATHTDELQTEQEKWLARVRHKPEWQPLQPIFVAADQMPLEIGENNQIISTGELADNDSYTIEFEGPRQPTTITALKMDVSAEQTRNFVLSQIKAKWFPDNYQPVQGQIVRIQKRGTGTYLHLAEIQVFSGGTNVALTGTAKQSTTAFAGEAKLAIDGNTNGDFTKKSVTHTESDVHPWIEIDLGKEFPIDKIVVWNRTDKNLQQRLRGYKISLLNSQREVVWEQSPREVPNPNAELSPDGSQSINFQAAIATYEQKGFPAASILADKADPGKGWAISGGTGQPQSLILITKEKQEFSGGKFQIQLEQRSKHKQHLLTHFAFTRTSDPAALEQARITPEIRKLIQQDDAKLNPDQRNRLNAFYRTITPVLEEERTELKQTEKLLAEIKPHTTVPVMQELPEQQARKTHIQIRGNWQSLGAEVHADVPATFHSIRAEDPDRLALAKWLIDRKNPLTSRVIANRYWEQIFGIGLVATSEEFGSQGDLPSHPQLLDWLAVELQESGWNLKHLLKLLVTSAAYRQQSHVTATLYEQDPDNRLLARGPRFRISAEMVRDQALFVSGLLSDKMYGPAVNPPQPILGLKAAFGSKTDWETSEGVDRYRRALYTTWRRSNPYPSMATFDAPNREVCTIRRIRTSTPLQALVTLNDPVYVEAAQALAFSVINTETDTDKRIDYIFQQTLIRPPTSAERERIARLIEQSKQHYQQHPNAANRFALPKKHQLKDNQTVAELAAWTAVSNVFLNLDELLMKP